MAVQKFRSAEEMQAAPVLAGPADAFERFLRHCARYRALVPCTHPKGVFRFRTLEEAQVARQCLEGGGAATCARSVIRPWRV